MSWGETVIGGFIRFKAAARRWQLDDSSAPFEPDSVAIACCRSGD